MSKRDNFIQTMLCMEEKERKVFIETLGLCEYCGALMTLEDLSVDALDAVWRCPKCEGILSHATFGFEKINEKNYEKTRWVGPEGKWVSARPTENFTLGNWRIDVNVSAPLPY